MLAVRDGHRGKGVATKLVSMSVDAMIEQHAEEVPLACHFTPFNNESDLIIDCSGNRSHQYRRYEALRTARFSQEQEAAPILFEWQFRLQIYALFERSRYVVRRRV